MGKRTNTAQWVENQNRWRINVQKDGERKSFYSSKSGRTGQREANAKADAWLEENIEVAGKRIEFYFSEYLERVKKTTSKSNWMQIDYFGRCWILPRIGNLKADRLTEQKLQDILDGAFAAGLSKKTIMGIRTTIVAFVKYLRKSKITTLLPEDLIIPNGAKSEPKKILQPEDIAILFSSDKTMFSGKETTEPFIYAYRFQVLTGLRPGELLGLEWGDIKEDIVFVKRSLNHLGEITKGKNANAQRSFALSGSAKKVLDDQRRINMFGRVFGDITQNVYLKHWRAYCHHNGITKTTPYELRHTFVSIAKGLPEGEIKALVGHSRSMDTFGTYGHTVNGEMEKTASKLNDIFSDILCRNL